jgi:hypothetical protein
VKLELQDTNPEIQYSECFLTPPRQWGGTIWGVLDRRLTGQTSGFVDANAAKTYLAAGRRLLIAKYLALVALYPMETADPTEARFRRLCAALRNRNVKATQIHFRPPITNARAFYLGQAVTGNSFVTSIELNLSLLRDYDHSSFIPKSTMISINRNSSPDSPPQSLVQLLHHIAHSPALGSVGLDGWNTASLNAVPVSIVRHFVNAIATNMNIHTLHLVKIQIPPNSDSFTTLISMFEPSTSSLDGVCDLRTHRRPHRFRRLTFRGCDFYSDAACEQLAAAIGVHSTLESLSVQAKSGSTLTDHILWRLGEFWSSSIATSLPQPPPSPKTNWGLHELILDSQFNELRISHTEALAHAVRACRSLEVLSLWYYSFDDVILLRPLVDALTAARSNEKTSSPTSLRRLSLKSCRFDIDSSHLFSARVLSAHPPAFQELQLFDMNNFEHYTGFSHRPGYGKFLAAPMLSVPYPCPEALQPCSCCGMDRLVTKSAGNGSRFQARPVYLDYLNMPDVRDQRTFFALCHDLAGHSTRQRIHIRRWSFGSIRREGAMILARCLPKMMYLKELRVALVDEQWVNSHYWQNLLLLAIQQNGSLDIVRLHTGPDIQRTRSFFTSELHQRLVSSYGERNRRLPMLLASTQPPLDSTEDAPPVFGAAVLFPTLFGVAKQATEMSPTLLLMGLLAIGEMATPKG